MTAKPKVLLIVTQDTKEQEGRFLRNQLQAADCEVVHLDASVRRTVGGAEISPEQIAGAAGKTIEEVRALGHEGKCQAVMIEGAIKLASTPTNVSASRVSSIGGSMGTTLGTTVMRAFPYGLPKLMISTLASGFTAPFVGLKDIAMLNAVCDISGLNSIAREVFRNGAAAMAGMAHAYRPARADGRPLVLISTLGTTERGMRALRESLEADGYEVMAFHTTGNGGKTLDSIAAERDVAAIVDMSLVEINDHIHNGICTAGPERATAGIATRDSDHLRAGKYRFLYHALADGGRRRSLRRPAFPHPQRRAHRGPHQRGRSERLADHVAGIVTRRGGAGALLRAAAAASRITTARRAISTSPRCRRSSPTMWQARCLAMSMSGDSTATSTTPNSPARSPTACAK